MYGRRISTTGSFSSKPKSSTKGVSKPPPSGGSKRSFRGSVSVSSSLRAEKIIPRSPQDPTNDGTMTSPIITLCIGPAGRLFACHEDILKGCPYFAGLFRNSGPEIKNRKVQLPDDIPEVFSCVLEYLYKGDYYPRLVQNKKTHCNELEDAVKNTGAKGQADATVTIERTGMTIMKDTLVYCAAEKYGLEELKRIALKKQGLRTGMQCQTILSSARYAYENTPDSDSKLRAHYLALIVRSRNTFKRSGTMQQEMEAGGKMFFDLFVAMANYIEDLSSAQ